MQKLNLSMSYRSTLRLHKDMGKDHDEFVTKWRESFISSLNGQLNYSIIYNIKIPLFIQNDNIRTSSCIIHDAMRPFYCLTLMVAKKSLFG